MFAAQERLAPGIACGLPLRLDLLEDRGFLQRQPDIDRNGDEQERDDKRDPPAPLGEGFVAQVVCVPMITASEMTIPRGGRCLEPPGVIPALLVRDVLGHVSDSAAVLPPRHRPWIRRRTQEDDGRRQAGTGLSTAVIGIIPTQPRSAWRRPSLLFVLRLIQGLCLGGEYGGAITYVAEHIADEKARVLHRVAPDIAHSRGSSSRWP